MTQDAAITIMTGVQVLSFVVFQSYMKLRINATPYTHVTIAPPSMNSRRTPLPRLLPHFMYSPSLTNALPTHSRAAPQLACRSIPSISVALQPDVHLFESGTNAASWRPITYSLPTGHDDRAARLPLYP